MSLSRRLFITISCAVLALLILPQTAYGSINPSANSIPLQTDYIDPGTGSIMIQVLIGSVAGGLALVGVYWKKVRAFFRDLGARRRRNDDKG